MNIIESSSVVIMSKSELSAIIDATAKRAVSEAITRLPQQDLPRPHQVTQSQAAEVMGVSRATIGKLVRSGILALNACGMIPMRQIDKVLGGT